MHAPPRRRNQRLLNRGLLARAYLFLGPMQAIAAMAAYAFVLHLGDWSSGQVLEAENPLYLQATTACLSAIVIMQVANVFLCRSERRSLFFQGIFSNKIILAGIGLELVLILLIDYTPWGNALFGTHPLPLSVWVFILPFAVGMIVLEELRKRIFRKFLLNGNGDFNV